MRKSIPAKPVLHVPVGVSLSIRSLDGEVFGVRALARGLGIVGELVVRPRPVWSGEFDENTMDDEPLAHYRLRCVDDLAALARKGARSDGVATVRYAWVDARSRGLGLGRSASALAAWEARRRWGAALVADACFGDGDTSESARGVWHALPRQSGVVAQGMAAWWSAGVRPVVVADVAVPPMDTSVGALLTGKVFVSRGARESTDGERTVRAVVGMMTDDGHTVHGDYQSSRTPAGKWLEVRDRQTGYLWTIAEPVVSEAESRRWARHQPKVRQNPPTRARVSTSHRLCLCAERMPPDAFELYYDDPPDDDDVRLSTAHRSELVTWLGERGRMLRVPVAYVTPREDNIFDARKLGAVVAWLRGGNRMTTHAPIATVMRVDRELVGDTQRAARTGRLESEYAMSRPFSTGHRDLDAYLAEPDDVDDDELEDLEARVEDAEAGRSGDLGQWWARLRDGNHRALGAVLSGESEIWVMVRKDELDQFGPGELR